MTGLIQKHLLALIFCLPFLPSAGQEDPGAILDRVAEKLGQYHDYSVDVEIEVDVSFIRIPVKHATMFFKQPDKVTFRSNDFIMLPKKGLDLSINKMLQEDYTAIFSGYDTLAGKSQYVIKVLPEARKSEVILANLWVDKERYVVTHMENFTRKRGSYQLDLEYGQAGIDLPTRIEVTFEVEQFNIPVKFMGKDIEVDEARMKSDEMQTGRVILRIGNYVINGGVNDSLFDDIPEN